MKRILVTGGTGFIGKNILESYLKDKYVLVTPGRIELDLSNDDNVAAYFLKNEFDVVMHCAIKPGHRNANDPDNIYFPNSRMFFNLLKHQDKWGKLINMGSGAIYDMRHYLPKMPESYFGTHIPVDQHGYWKYNFGKLLPGLQNVYDLRIFGVFGKYEDYLIRFISNNICKSIFDLPITIRQNRKFDYLYIDDLMPILGHFIEIDPVEKSFNVTPDNAIELLEIANIIKRITGNDKDIVVTEEGMGLEYSGDNSLLRQEIKGLELTPIEKAIQLLYEWYNENSFLLKKELFLKDK